MEYLPRTRVRHNSSSGIKEGVILYFRNGIYRVRWDCDFEQRFISEQDLISCIEVNDKVHPDYDVYPMPEEVYLSPDELRELESDW